MNHFASFQLRYRSDKSGNPLPKFAKIFNLESFYSCRLGKSYRELLHLKRFCRPMVFNW